MRRLNLDYRATKPKSLVEIFVLMCGVLSVTLTLWNYQNSGRDIAELEVSVGNTQRVFEGKNPKQRQEGAQRTEEIVAINSVISQLALPWEGLFSALELASNNEVALLSIEPDVTKNVVKVMAESKTSKGMLDYLKRLQQSSALDDVLLQRHEIQTLDPDKPLRFVVVGVWKDVP